MKILLVLAKFNRHKWDALTEQAWSIARLLTASGEAQCAIAAVRSSGEPALEVVKNVTIRRFSVRSPWRKRFQNIFAGSKQENTEMPGLEIYLKRNRFDLVHVMTPNWLCETTARIAAEQNIPCLVTCRSEEFMAYDAAVKQNRQFGDLPQFNKIFGRYSGGLKRMDRIFCTDKKLLEAFSGKISKERLLKWSAGVDWEYFAKPAVVDFRKVYQLSESKMLLLSVGHLSESKNQKMLLEIVSLLKRRGWNCQLLVLGWAADQEYLKEFESYVAEHKLNDTVKVIPGLPPGDERFRAAYQTASLVLLPARFEVSASAVLEAWSAGVPVVASPAGSGGEIITDTVTGRLVPVRDFQEWVSCCEELLNDRNRKELEKMRSAARIEAKKYAWRERLNELLNIYKDVINNK